MFISSIDFLWYNENFQVFVVNYKCWFAFFSRASPAREVTPTREYPRPWMYGARYPACHHDGYLSVMMSILLFTGCCLHGKFVVTHTLKIFLFLFKHYSWLRHKAAHSQLRHTIPLEPHPHERLPLELSGKVTGLLATYALSRPHQHLPLRAHLQQVEGRAG